MFLFDMEVDHIGITHPSSCRRKHGISEISENAAVAGGKGLRMVFRFSTSCAELSADRDASICRFDINLADYGRSLTWGALPTYWRMLKESGNGNTGSSVRTLTLSLGSPHSGRYSQQIQGVQLITFGCSIDCS